ncbi:MAG: hypothetical protein EOL89_14145 [Actinobacteria bacterium]|nr:hypothetical protein [Actinomycetota bacterium]
MHAVLAFLTVVLVPVSALGLLVIMLAPRSRGRLGRPVLAGIALGAVATLATGASGLLGGGRAGMEVADLEDHVTYGTTLQVLVLALLAAALAWYQLQRMAARLPLPENRAVPPAFEMLAGIATLGIVFATLITVAAAWSSGASG